MTPSDVSTAPVYDPYHAHLHADPYPAELYRWMRDECPLYHNETHGFWALSRFDDVQETSRDWHTFSSAEVVDLDGTGGAVYGTGNFLELDPPRHDALRNVVRKAFTPREVAQLEAMVREEAATLFAPFRAARGGDIARDFCWQLTLNVAARRLGIPREDRPHVERLFFQTLERSPGETAIPEVAVTSATELRDYLRELIVNASDEAPGLLGQIAAAHRNGELATDEIPGLALLLFGAGVDAPGGFAANALLLLERHPDQREALRTGRATLDDAVEELLRFESPVQNLARTTTKPIRLHGTDIPQGGIVLLVYAAANRDDRRWQDPDVLDLSRPRQRHLAFGEGLHFCLGAGLARLQAKVVLETMLSEAPDYAVTGPLTRIVKQSDWGVLKLPVGW
jgi:cytochrome P450